MGLSGKEAKDKGGAASRLLEPVMLNPADYLALCMDPSMILRAQGMEPDRWQREFLLSNARRSLLLCSRGAGKSRVVSALALHTAIFQPKSLILLVSRAQRQSLELFRYVKQGFRALDEPLPAIKENETTLELANGSRIVALPGKEANIRSYQGVALLVLDEASRIPDDLYFAVRPMLLVSKGRLVALTTPFGRRGWFHEEWVKGGDAFTRTSVTWQQCPRITKDDIDRERESMGDGWVQQEYECQFTALEGLVYPEFDRAVWDILQAPPPGKWVGGIDFGWRNPFAAVWGTLDSDDILWITGERYLRQTPLHEHRAALKALGPVMWYADPAGASDIAELRSADIRVRKADNAIRLGIQCVNARITSGRLRVSRVNCPNLIWESKLYRYPTAQEKKIIGENPVDADNHALAALRYLVSRVDARVMARLRGDQRSEKPLPRDESPQEEEVTVTPEQEKAAKPVKNVWNTVDNPEVWRNI